MLALVKSLHLLVDELFVVHQVGPHLQIPLHILYPEARYTSRHATRSIRSSRLPSELDLAAFLVLVIVKAVAPWSVS